MSHKRNNRPDIRVRELPPTVRTTKQGTELLCPFCKPPHPILPNEATPCGTQIRVIAVQTIYSKHTVAHEKMICVKCKQGGGEMIQYMNSFVHLQDCNPNLKLLPQMPEFDRMAGVVFKLPAKLRAFVEKRTGIAQQVEEIDTQGNKTGKVLGYFFMKITGAPDGRTTPNPAT